MQLTEAVRTRIYYYTKLQNITMHQLSLNAGIPYSTLSSFINGKSKGLTLATLLHICEGLNVDLSEFFSDNLFVDVEDNR